MDDLGESGVRGMMVVWMMMVRREDWEEGIMVVWYAAPPLPSISPFSIAPSVSSSSIYFHVS